MNDFSFEANGFTYSTLFICIFLSDIALIRLKVKKGFSFCILMGIPKQINTIRMGLSIIYSKGSQVEIFK